MNQTGERDLFAIEKRYKFITSPHKIDDYDSSILEDRAYLNMEDNAFKLEYQIGMLEDNLSVINEEIEGAKSIDDTIRLNILNKKKLRMERKLKVLIYEYSKLNPAAKIIGWISYMFSERKRKKITFGDFMLKNFWAKVSKKMNKIYNLKLALEKLSNINRSVDELIQMQAPVKDAKDRYERLTAYINKANNIHNEIYNNIKF